MSVKEGGMGLDIILVDRIWSRSKVFQDQAMSLFSGMALVK